LIIYHGGTEVVEVPKIIRQEIGRDFGAGFYTTDIEVQAIRWAQRKAKIAGRYSRAVKAVVNVYEFNEQQCAALKTKDFPDASLAWMDLVISCRSDSTYTHGFDIVTGKIANDNVGETIEYVLRGIMRKEDALEKLKFEKINNQICFCTDAALSAIRFIESKVM
jgi:hypothetical protein